MKANKDWNFGESLFQSRGLETVCTTLLLLHATLTYMQCTTTSRANVTTALARRTISGSTAPPTMARQPSQTWADTAMDSLMRGAIVEWRQFSTPFTPIAGAGRLALDAVNELGRHRLLAAHRTAFAGHIQFLQKFTFVSHFFTSKLQRCDGRIYFLKPARVQGGYVI